MVEDGEISWARLWLAHARKASPPFLFFSISRLGLTPIRNGKRKESSFLLFRPGPCLRCTDHAFFRSAAVMRSERKRKRGFAPIFSLCNRFQEEKLSFFFAKMADQSEQININLNASSFFS